MNSGLKSIVIGQSVEDTRSYLLGGNAFKSCRYLGSNTLPDGIRFVLSYKFKYCSSLTCIVILASVKYVEKGAFANCTSLTSITIK